MKKFHNIAIALIATAIFTACRSGSHVVISSDDNNNDVRLEYWGNVILNGTKTAIESISSTGYIDYKKNNEDLHITNDNDGRFHYELNGNKTDHLDETGQELLEEAIEKIAKLQRGH